MYSFITSNDELNELLLRLVTPSVTERRDKLVRMAWRLKMTITTTLMVLGSDRNTLSELKKFADDHENLLLIAYLQDHTVTMDAWCSDMQTFENLVGFVERLSARQLKKGHA